MRFDPQGIVTQIQYNARIRPHAAAACYQEQILTYQQLHESSHMLALQLKVQGVKAGSIVGVCIRPGLDILVAIAAIFHCQAVYLPLDPDHPQAHVQRILKETNPRLVLSFREHIGQALPPEGPWFLLDERRLHAGFISCAPYAAPLWETRPAYLMYTSGTTGQPKGVLLSADNLHHYLQSAQEAFRFEPGDIFCNVARYTFSISLFDLLLPLAVGACVRLLDRADIFDLSRLHQHLAQSTVFHAGPSLLSTLFRSLGSPLPSVKNFPNLRHLSTGGDIVLPTVMEGMKEFFPKAEIFVIYGTTEISCMGTYLAIPRNQKQTKTLVGKPFPGVELMIQDGEIVFSGPGISPGYFKNPMLTADRFNRTEDRILYRTGDFGQLQPDGNLEMLGRRDFQVQLRGVRLELTAIENCLLELGLASHCVVHHRRNDEDSGFLVAFLAGATTSDASFVRRKLSERLPAEMVPNRILFLDALPTTFNGKLDRMKLMTWPLELEKAEGEFSNLQEETIARVLGSSLGLNWLSCDQNYFEAGGHSLLAILVLSELKEQHAIIIPPVVFFQNPTARALARFCQTLDGDPEFSSACNLVALNSLSNQKPIFFLAGAHIYRSLAQALDHNWSAFGIISDQECNPSQPTAQKSMEELAHDYMQSILQQQLRGPYYLLGYSFAGILAFEVARQLTAAGHEVKRLFLLDATLPENVFRWQYRMRQVARALSTRPGVFLNYLLRKLRPIRFLADPRTAAFERDRGHRNSIFARDYMKRMQRYSGAAVLFVAGERLKQKPLRSRSCGWRPYIPDLKVVRSPSDHNSLIKDPECVRQIAREILACGD